MIFKINSSNYVSVNLLISRNQSINIVAYAVHYRRPVLEWLRGTYLRVNWNTKHLIVRKHEAKK